jgi:hypothetical protein
MSLDLVAYHHQICPAKTPYILNKFVTSIITGHTIYITVLLMPILPQKFVHLSYIMNSKEKVTGKVIPVRTN